MRKLRVVVAALLVPAGALGFVMSAWQVLSRVARHRAEMELTSLVVRGTLTFGGAEASAAAAALKLPPGGEISVPATVTYRIPGSCKIDVGGTSASYVNGNLKTSGAALPSLKAFANGVCPLVALTTTEELIGFLKGRGVDTSSVSLGRVNGIVCYVIGARRPKDTATPALWVEKERLDGLRLVAKDRDGLEDVRMIDYTSPLAGAWHPRVVEIRHGEDLTRFVADKLETNTKIPDGTF